MLPMDVGTESEWLDKSRMSCQDFVECGEFASVKNASIHTPGPIQCVVVGNLISASNEWRNKIENPKSREDLVRLSHYGKV